MPRPKYGNDEEARSLVGEDDAMAATVFGAPPAPVPQPRPQSQRARQVSMNEFGYPIVQREGVDPGEVTSGGDNADEDGVSSI